MNPGKWWPNEAKAITASETSSGVSHRRARINTTGTISSGVTTMYDRSHHADTIQVELRSVAEALGVDTVGALASVFRRKMGM